MNSLRSQHPSLREASGPGSAAAGQEVYTTTVNHTGNNSTQQVKLPKLAQGTYHLQITGADGKTESQKIVVSN